MFGPLLGSIFLFNLDIEGFLQLFKVLFCWSEVPFFNGIPFCGLGFLRHPCILEFFPQ